ncbi:uncharacterized protein J4E84_002686 [Alternaria hordeiaustralica]|uniref:uncharacterized protein n=1 Tax=Alternaria hordeiaustralica TaxID=1187925 RepID=UPI0020C2C0C0|nr:uncharacterized protein J4E84_002686 [Alternaria hordeiaustralica]KAI4694106.1 hypothetical protein J4E84_002686 [Alternaria hordeiaustralica]
MVHLPQEILDNVFLNLWNTEQPTTERFHNVPKISIRTILNCRLVARRWFDSKALTSVFVGVLSLTPFVWYNHRLPALEEISEIPKYSCYFSGAITICGMDLGLVTLKDHDRWGPGRDELDKENSVTHYLVHLLRRFSWIEHFRYYPIHPNCLDGTWPNWEVTDSDRTSLETCFQGGPDRSRYGYPALDEGEYSWQGVQKESQWIFPKIMEAFEESHVWLSTLESPLLGNRASHCAITFGTALPETEENLYFGRDLFRWFPRGLKRVAITITQHIRRPLLISDGLEELKNLEYLDITLSRSPPHCSRWGGPFDEPFRLSYSFLSNMSYQLEKLKEFRLMADQQHLFDEHDIIHSMKIFPNVKKLAFAHILLDEPGNWSSLLQRLATLNLEELRLLDPRNLNTDYRMFKYVEDDHLLLAAQKVRLIDTNSLWTAETHPGLSRTFEYPGFAIFEKGEDDC